MVVRDVQARDFNIKDLDVLHQVQLNKDSNKKEKLRKSSIFKVNALYGYPMIPDNTDAPYSEGFIDLFLDWSKKMPIGDFMLGYLYETGLGVKRDKDKAFSFYNKALERESIDSMYLLGLIDHSALTEYLVTKKGSLSAAIERYKNAQQLF